jgi:hypothetical protein
MSDTWFDFLLLTVLTVGTSIQAVGRWRGSGPWLRSKNTGVSTLNGVRNRRLGSVVSFPPLIFGSADLILISSRGLVREHESVFRAGLYFLEYAGFSILIISVVLSIYVYNFGKPQLFIPPTSRNMK